MDIPTLIVIVSLLISAAAFIYCRAMSYRPRALSLCALFITVIWTGMTICGEIIFPWAGNATCSQFIGCVQGFLGYDAFEHLFFGVAGALLIVILSARYPRFSILHQEPWKAALSVIALIALASVAWEILECAHDALRLDILHEPLRNIRLHINLLDQPTNLDTMGDLTFSLLGSVIGFLMTIAVRPRIDHYVAHVP